MDGFERLLDRIVAALRAVPGIEAVVLGGSRARGVHRPDSDIDLGIYYDAATLDLITLEAVAQSLHDQPGGQLVAGPGGWGAWVDGGAWLTVEGQRVDFILRDLERVATVIHEAQAGRFSTNYQPGHPHAFVSIIYMGELAICRLLWDRTGAVTQLQTEARIYPPALRRSLLSFFGFEAGFSCALAETYAGKDEAYYVVAHLVRAVSCLNQVLFALNGTWCLNEKGAVRMIETFPIRPEAYKRKVDLLFARASDDRLSATFLLRALVDEVDLLVQKMSGDAGS